MLKIGAKKREKKQLTVKGISNSFNLFLDCMAARILKEQILQIAMQHILLIMHNKYVNKKGNIVYIYIEDRSYLLK